VLDGATEGLQDILGDLQDGNYASAAVGIALETPWGKAVKPFKKLKKLKKLIDKADDIGVCFTDALPSCPCGEPCPLNR